MHTSPDISALESRLRDESNIDEKLALHIELAGAYRKLDDHKADHFWQEALRIARSMSDESALGMVNSKIAQFHYLNGSYDLAMHHVLESNKLYKGTDKVIEMAANHILIGRTYQVIRRYSAAIKNFEKAQQIYRKADLQREVINTEYLKGNAYNWNRQLEKANKCLQSAKRDAQKLDFTEIEMLCAGSLGILYTKMEDLDSAERYFKYCLELEKKAHHPALRIQIKKSLGNLYNKLGHNKKAIVILKEALEGAEEEGEGEDPNATLLLIHEFLSNSYEQLGDYKTALVHFKAYNQLQSKILSEQSIHKIAIIENEYKNESIEKESEIHRLKNVELTQAYEELKSAQQQLITHERLALLGQLTTGIAHEIQNPLNFVKNFAEVSSELVADLFNSKIMDRMDVSKDDFVYLTSILNDLQRNNEKIRKHGMRAANIVKSMLMHAREKFSIKQSININSLLQESIELATQGLQSSERKNGIQVTKNLLDTEQEIEVYPNNMGRVFLNIMNNAFYAINERIEKGETEFVPEVKIKTRREKDLFVITIKNNGMPIPQDIRNKIFNPFFTTKLNGEGTGLGLSISQDIVVKEHGGQLRASEDADGFTSFEVRLPVKTMP